MDNTAMVNELAITAVNPTKKMTLTYIVSLSLIALLSLVVHVMLDKIIEEQSGTATLVNVSGQQRYLSQRTSLFALEYITSGSNEAKKEASAALALMRRNHDFLLAQYHFAQQADLASPFSEAMHALYFKPPNDVSKKIDQFSELVEKALASRQPINSNEQTDFNLEFLALAKFPLLASLNEVVKQYEIESIEKVSALRKAQQIVLFIIIFALVAEAVFIFRPMVSSVSRFSKRLQLEANYDHLTGLLNRRSFAIVVEKAAALSVRHQHNLSTVTFDIDHFKAVNDTYGHDVGDKAIQHISDLIKNNMRASDVVARFGGEEFVVLLPQTQQEDAVKLAEKIRLKIAQSPLSVADGILEITVSAGVSQFKDEDKTFENVLKRADTALYEAKNTGRNKVCEG